MFVFVFVCQSVLAIAQDGSMVETALLGVWTVQRDACQQVHSAELEVYSAGRIEEDRAHLKAWADRISKEMVE